MTEKRDFLTPSRDGVLVAPSLLSADFAHLCRDIERAEQAGADLFHLDVMDGHFVPNITIGPLVMKAIRPCTDLPVEVHLMISEPARYAPRFAEAGADGISFHVEAVDDPVATARALKALGVYAGVSLNPATPFEALAPLKDEVDYVLVMTVNPGFGGQAFMPGPLEKMARLRDEWGVPIAVDGGVSPDTAGRVAAAGARLLVAGSAVYGHDDLTQPIRRIRDAATASL